MLLAPLGTPFRPIPDRALAAKFEALAERCGVKNVQILVGDDDTAAKGITPFRRIVLADDFLRDLTVPEQTVLYAHELKHYLLDNGWKAIAVIAGLLAGGLWLVDLLGRAAIHIFANRLGFSRLSDPASLPLALFILGISWLLVGLPAFNAIQRNIELEADRFALELTHENHAEALAQVRYSTYMLNEYYWFHRIWRANHPSQAERVRLANTYHPWDSGGALVYGHVCRMP
jgi:Zn-dependent protease with chaperone function